MTERPKFLPALEAVIRSGDPALKADLRRAIYETWGGGPDAFVLRVAESISQRPRTVFGLLSLIADAVDDPVSKDSG